MNQIYFTFCCTNHSLSNSGGDRARAASGGITENKAKTYKNFSYDNPSPKLFPLGLSQKDLFLRAPIALRWTSTPQRVLSHSVLAPADRETRRDGNYFSHLLGDFAPNECDPWKAINLWGSSFWRRADSEDIPTKLPEISMRDIPKGSLNDKMFYEFLSANDSNRKMFKFILSAWISRFALDSSKKIVIMTDNTEKIALCLWGLMRSLPSFCWNQMTFSTYEKIGKTLPNLDVIGFWQPNLSVEEERLFQSVINPQNYNFFPSKTWRDPFASSSCALAEGIMEKWLNLSWSFFDTPYLSKDVRDMNLEWLIKYQPEKATVQDLWKGLESPSLRKIIWQNESQKGLLWRDASNSLSPSTYQGEKMAFLLRTFSESRDFFGSLIANLATSDKNLPLLKTIWETWLEKYRSEFPNLESYLFSTILPEKVDFETFEYIASRVWMNYQNHPNSSQYELINKWNNVPSINYLCDFFKKNSGNLEKCKKKILWFCFPNDFKLDHFLEVIQLLQDNNISQLVGNVLNVFCQEMATNPKFSKHITKIIATDEVPLRFKIVFGDSLNESDRDKIASQICKENTFAQIRNSILLSNFIQNRFPKKESRKEKNNEEFWNTLQWNLIFFLTGFLFCLIIILLSDAGLLR